MKIVRFSCSVNGNAQEFHCDKPITIIQGKTGVGKTAMAESLTAAIWHPFINVPDNDCLCDTVTFSSDNGIILTIAKTDQSTIRISERETETEKILYAGSIENRSEIISALDSLGMKGERLRHNLLLPDYNAIHELIFIDDEALVGEKSLVHFDTLNSLLIIDETLFHHAYAKLDYFFGEKRTNKTSLFDQALQSESELRDVIKKIELIEIRNTRQNNLKKEIAHITENLDALNSEIDELNKNILILNTLDERLSEIDKLNQHLDKIREELNQELALKRTIAEMEAEIKELFPRFINRQVFDNQYLDQLQKAFYEIRDIQQVISDIESSEKEKKKSYHRFAFGILAAGAAIFIAAATKAPLSPELREIVMTVAGVISLGGAAAFFFLASLINPAKEIMTLQTDLLNAEEQLYEMLKKGNLEIHETQIAELYDFLIKHFQDILDYRDRIGELKELQGKLRGNEYLLSIKNDLDTLQKEEHGYKTAMENDLKGKQFLTGEISHQAIQDQIVMHQEKLTGWEEEYRKLTILKDKISDELNQYEDETDFKNLLIERKDSLEEIIAATTKTIEASTYIHGLLEKAISVRRENRITELVMTAMNRFNYLTDNQYMTLYDEGIFSDIIKKNLFPANISSTVMHHMKLAIKMSLPHFLIDEIDSLPLIIDEPFYNMDEDRIERFGQLCTEIAANRQLIILTQQTILSKWGASLVIN